MIRYFGILKNFRDKLFNKRNGRDNVGNDMYGNKYYQNYDVDGFPTKREVEYKEGMHNSIMDPIWTG